jgi:hypothetical protein
VATDHAPLEIACDESGYEGEKLVGTTTDVFAHGSVHLSYAAAADCMAELRARIRSPATEYKANHLLREKHRRVLVWLLSPASPAFGAAHVYLVDKTTFLLDRLVTVLLDDPAQAAVLTREVILAREARTAAHWRPFLQSANDLLRTKERPDAVPPVEGFVRAVEALRGGGPDEPAGQALKLLAAARSRAEAHRMAVHTSPPALPLLDPLVPAIERAVRFWGHPGRPVTIVHDRQNTLRPDRVAALRDRIPALAGLTLVSSENDPRVQVADIVAGAVRKIASDGLVGAGDPELTALLPPFIDSASLLPPSASAPPHQGR